MAEYETITVLYFLPGPSTSVIRYPLRFYPAVKILQGIVDGGNELLDPSIFQQWQLLICFSISFARALSGMGGSFKNGTIHIIISFLQFFHLLLYRLQ
jgi:hypothetical protein